MTTDTHPDPKVAPARFPEAGIAIPATAVHCRCGAWWTGANAGHCTAEASAQFPLGDGDALLSSQWNAHLYESPIDGGCVPAQLFADLLRTHPARRVEHRSLRPPATDVFECMIVGRELPEVRWSIVGANVIDVVNVLSIGNPSIENAMLVGLDVLVRPNPPAQSDVSMVGNVATRLFLRDSFTRAELSNFTPVTRLSARNAKAALRRASNDTSTHSAIPDGHNSILLQVTTLCHRSFTTTSAFDKHRAGSHAAGTRHCVDPATVLTKAGEPALVPANRQWAGWSLPGTWEGPDA